MATRPFASVRKDGLLFGLIASAVALGLAFTLVVPYIVGGIVSLLLLSLRERTGMIIVLIGWGTVITSIIIAFRHILSVSMPQRKFVWKQLTWAFLVLYALVPPLLYADKLHLDDLTAPFELIALPLLGILVFPPLYLLLGLALDLLRWRKERKAARQ